MEINQTESPLTDEFVIHKIYIVRGQKVMIDTDLAALYGVPTKRLNEQLTRNLDRFPEDFAFRLNQSEYENLKSQIATSSWGGKRKIPYAFTELGIAMLSSVLKSKKSNSSQYHYHANFCFLQTKEHGNSGNKINASGNQ
jgi:hypothetical protein